MIQTIKFHTLWRLSRWNERVQTFVAWRLPHWLVRWALVRAYSKAWADAGNKTPDDLTYREVWDAS